MCILKLIIIKPGERFKNNDIRNITRRAVEEEKDNLNVVSESNNNNDKVGERFKNNDVMKMAGELNLEVRPHAKERDKTNSRLINGLNLEKSHLKGKGEKVAQNFPIPPQNNVTTNALTKKS